MKNKINSCLVRWRWENQGNFILNTFRKDIFIDVFRTDNKKFNSNMNYRNYPRNHQVLFAAVHLQPVGLLYSRLYFEVSFRRSFFRKWRI